MLLAHKGYKFVCTRLCLIPRDEAHNANPKLLIDSKGAPVYPHSPPAVFDASFSAHTHLIVQKRNALGVSGALYVSSYCFLKEVWEPNTSVYRCRRDFVLDFHSQIDKLFWGKRDAFCKVQQKLV